jgi:hypothetical protein
MKKTKKKTKFSAGAKKKKTAKKKKKIKKKTKPTGGFPFDLKLTDTGLHWVLTEEANLGGHHKMKGTVQPEKALDMYRAVLFFMWGIPLDEPIDTDIEKSIKAAVKKIEKLKKAEEA